MSVSVIFGGTLAFVLFSLFFGIRHRIVSVKLAALIAFLFPIGFEIILVMFHIEEPVDILCLGGGLSLIFGLSTYFFGRALENWISQKE